jgi:hypothetical protein
MSEIQEYDMVALLEEVKTFRWPTEVPLTLPRGSVGTVVMEHNDGEAFEVEFADKNGQAYALLPLKPSQLLLLHHEAPSAVAA